MWQPLILSFASRLPPLQCILMHKPDSVTPLCNSFNTVHLGHRIKWLSQSLKTAHLLPFKLLSHGPSFQNACILSPSPYTSCLEFLSIYVGFMSIFPMGCFHGPWLCGYKLKSLSEPHLCATQAQGVGFGRTIPVPKRRLFRLAKAVPLSAFFIPLSSFNFFVIQYFLHSI